MVNGGNARIIVIGLFITVFALIAAIATLSALHTAVPEILTGSMTTVIGIIIGAIGVNFQLPPKEPPSGTGTNQP